eukprot:SAG31_NODE_26021_length_450_cov_0.732194_1_plen_113_part_01
MRNGARPPRHAGVRQPGRVLNLVRLRLSHRYLDTQCWYLNLATHHIYYVQVLNLVGVSCFAPWCLQDNANGDGLQEWPQAVAGDVHAVVQPPPPPGRAKELCDGLLDARKRVG